MQDDKTAAPQLTVFFIVEPPEYQNFACHLAASIRQNFAEPVTMVGYCPAHRMDELSPSAVAALDRMGVPVRPMETEGRFAEPYPHGNKILACLEPRETPYAAFVDSDVLCLRSNRVEALVAEGAVCLTPAASMVWAGQEIWPGIYDACGLEIPDERIPLLRARPAEPVIPYFSSGLVIYPEGYRFAETWYETARTIDAIEGLENKRPYLDQMSLPLAIQKAGLRWSLLPEEQHYILGGRLRRTPFPTDRDIRTVHYRQWKVLKENGLSEHAKDMLEAEIGVRRVKKFAP